MRLILLQIIFFLDAILSFDRKNNDAIREGESVVCKFKANPPRVPPEMTLEGRGGDDPEIATEGTEVVAMTTKLHADSQSEEQTFLCRTVGFLDKEMEAKVVLRVQRKLKQ